MLRRRRGDARIWCYHWFLIFCVGISEFIKVVACLYVHPKLCGHIEEKTEAYCGVGCDAPLAFYNFADGSLLHACMFCKRVGSNTEWYHKLLFEDFSGMNGDGAYFFLCHNFRALL